MVSEVEKVIQKWFLDEKVTFRSLYTISGGPFLGPAKTPEDFLRVSLKRSTFQTLFHHFFITFRQKVTFSPSEVIFHHFFDTPRGHFFDPPEITFSTLQKSLFRLKSHF